MVSNNIFEVAERNQLWNSATATTIPFHFTRVYGNNIGKGSAAVTRRVWRVFTLAAPSLNKPNYLSNSPLISPFTDGLATFGYGPDLTEPYPFSVPVDTPLTVQDIMNMNRDQFEGTLFDMTTGIGEC